MKVRDIITNEGLVTDVGAKLFGKAASAGAAKMAPIAAKQAAKAEKVAQFKGDLALMGGVVGEWFKLVKNVALAWGIAEPMVVTGWEIHKLNNQLKEKSIDPVEYEKQVQYWLGKAVTQIAAIGLTKFSVSTAGRLIGTLPFASGAGKLITKLSGPAAAAFGVYLTTPAGADAFAKWFVGESFAPWLAKFMREIVGSWAKAGYDTITGHEDARGPIGSDDKNPVSSALADIKPSENPYGMKFDPVTGNWLNR
jgi:hypothetical protein